MIEKCSNKDFRARDYVGKFIKMPVFWQSAHHVYMSFCENCGNAHTFDLSELPCNYFLSKHPLECK